MPPLPDAAVARRPLRILYPASLTVGGAERQMLMLAERLPRDRFDVSFILLGGWTPNADLAVAAGATVHALGDGSLRTTTRPVRAVRVAQRIARYVRVSRRERYDVVDAWLYQGYGLAAVTRPLTRVPVLISGRVSLSKFKERFGPAERAVDALARRTSDQIFANSAAVADDVAAREGVDRASIRIIRNGVLIPDPLGGAERDAIRAGWGATPETLVIGYVGSMRPGKGHDRIVEAFPHVLSSVPSARLVFVGGGPTQAALERRVDALGLADRVVMTGDVLDARTIVAGLDVFVSASEAEGLPNSVLEAAAAGIGIVTTAAGGTVEIVDDGQTGILVPVGDDAALRAGLIQISLDAALRARLGSAAREHVARAFGVDRFIRETGDLYEELAARKIQR